MLNSPLISMFPSKNTEAQTKGKDNATSGDRLAADVVLVTTAQMICGAIGDKIARTYHILSDVRYK